MINYDPDSKPEIDPEAMAEAEQLGLRVIHVICDEAGAKVGDQSGVSFVTFGDFLPRAGDRMQLEDGTVCEVKRVYFKLSRPDGSRLSVLVPNVLATRISPDRE